MKKILSLIALIVIIFASTITFAGDNINPEEMKQEASVTTPYSYSNPKIPRGFTHTEGTWNAGYTIQDEIGNEFVWVPVDGTNITYEDHYLRLFYSVFPEITKVEPEAEIKNSVNKFGGFYIAKYEAGVPEDSGYTTYDEIKNIVGVPVSKKEVLPWNLITWENAKASAESMYNEDKIGAMCRLINTDAWDTTLKWFEKTGTRTNNEIVNDSTSWGNYLNSEFTYELDGETYEKPADSYGVLLTGIFKTNNIYDIAGNYNEMTTHPYSTVGYLYRGGGFPAYGTDTTVLTEEGEEEDVIGMQAYNANVVRIRWSRL